MAKEQRIYTLNTEYVTLPKLSCRRKGVIKNEHLNDLCPPDGESIWKLVTALHSIGIETEASCEGHLDLQHHQHPWIFLHTNQMSILNYFLKEYNGGHNVKWEHGDNNCYFRLQPLTYNNMCRSCNKHAKMMSQNQLIELQQSSVELAKFIFSNRNRVNGATVRVTYDLVLK